MTSIDVAKLPGPIETIGGEPYIRTANGDLIRIANIKPQHLLEDEQVRKIIGYAEDLSAQIARFKGHTFEDLGSLDAVIDQEYGVKRRGKKGNVTYQTVDGLMKVQVQVADLLDFGSELQAAKALIDECLIEWSETSHPALASIVSRAFNVDKAGQINKAELFRLLRENIEDARWQRAMDAIRDAIRITGSKVYYRFYKRDDPNGRWQAITIDLAKA